MTPADTFWAVFAAVLGANLLTVGFVWGMSVYSRLEKEGREKGDDAHAPLVIMCVTAFFLAGGLYMAWH